MVRETAKVGIVVERRVLDNPWVDHAWVPVEALMGAPAATPWTVLEQGAKLKRYYAGTFEIEFFGTDTTMYRENLHSRRPSLWVALRHTDADPGVMLHLVTADPAEAEALTGTDTDIIEAVAMPIEIQRRLAAFVEAHHVERPFVKRKRDRADPEAMARQDPGSRRKKEQE